MQRAWRLLVSLRTTAALMALLAALIFLNAVLPQAAQDPASLALAARRGPLARFLLVDVGLGDLSTSAPFLASLVAFFVNLAAVLVDRFGATVRRLRRGQPGPAALAAMLADAPAAPLALETGAEERIREVLATLGYRSARAGEGHLWAVKHPMALLGFPIFHLAFFVIAVGGVRLYLTRDVVAMTAVEGQVVESAAGKVVRRAKLGEPPPVAVAVERVDVALKDGLPTDLRATLQIDPPEGEVQLARVNHPAVRRDLSVLVNRAGVAPVLWLTDPEGFTLDRVAVVTSNADGLPARAPIGRGGLVVAVEPIPIAAGFPVRETLPRTPISLRVLRDGKEAFAGSLRAGEAADLGDSVLRLQEVRYWVGLQLVSERGGGWLVAGFALSIAGIAWRMVWHRRELAIQWGAGVLRVGGRSELYPRGFQGELDRIRSTLAAVVGREVSR